MPLPVSRRAERFAAALDGDLAESDAATQRLVGTTTRLAALQVAGPPRTAAGRAAIVAAASATLAEAAKHAAAPAAHAAASTGAATAPVTAPAAAAHAVGQAVALKVVTGIVALAVIGGGVEVAAQRSLPGQPFYGLKRATEAAQLHLSGGATAQAEQRLDQARTRLAEIKALWPDRDSSAHSQQIADLMAALDKDIGLATGPLLAAGGSAAATLKATVTQIQVELAALPRTLTGAGATAAATSLSLLGSLTSAVTGLPTLVPGRGPTAPVSGIPTQPAQVQSSGQPVVAPTTAAPTGVVPSTAPTTPHSPSAPVTVPSIGLPTLTPPPVAPPSVGAPSLPPAVGSAAPAPVASVVSCLLHVVGCLT